MIIDKHVMRLWIFAEMKTTLCLWLKNDTDMFQQKLLIDELKASKDTMLEWTISPMLSIGCQY